MNRALEWIAITSANRMRRKYEENLRAVTERLEQIRQAHKEASPPYGGQEERTSNERISDGKGKTRSWPGGR